MSPEIPKTIRNDEAIFENAPHDCKTISKNVNRRPKEFSNGSRRGQINKQKQPEKNSHLLLK